MRVRRRATLLLALVVASAALLPLPVAAHRHSGQLRGGLTALAAGEAAPGASIETRTVAGTPEIAVSIDVGGAPDARTRALLREAGLAVTGTWRTTIEGYIAPARLEELARVDGVRSITPIRRPVSTFVGPAPAIHGATGWQPALLGSSVPNGRTISRTTRIVLTTTIRPIGVLAARGRARIDLFQRTSTGWTRRKTIYANADAAGRAKATIRLPSAGSWWIRSRAEPTTTNGASPWTTGVRYTVR